MNRPQNLAILGATGSIGLSTLDVAARHPQRFRIFALSANERIDELAGLCLRYQPRYAVVAQALQAEALGKRLQPGITEILVGPPGLERIAAHAQTHAGDAVAAATFRWHKGPVEKGEIIAGAGDVIGVKEMIGADVVLVDGSFD